MTKESERRAHARIAVPISARLVAGSTETEFAVRDLSLSGIILYRHQPPGPAGTRVTLKLALTAGIKPLLVQGKIVRSVLDPKAARGTILGFGVQFEGGGEEQRRSLAALLDRAMMGKGTLNRAFPRVYYLLEVVCRTTGEVKALLLDIGEGGVGLTVERAFAKDEDVTVEIGVAVGAPLALAGWVVSSEAIKGIPGSFRVGVRFGRLSAPTRQQLKLFLEALYRR